MNIRFYLWAALAVTILIAWGSEAVAETSVHGISIPTAEGSLTPTIGICGSLASPPIEGGIQGRLADRRMSGTDSRTYGAAYCIPVSDTGPRPVTGPAIPAVVVPPIIADAIEQVEHELVAYFDHDSSDMNDIEATDSVGIIVDWLRTTSDAGLNIQGHTDSTGDEAYNEALSFRRAEAAKALFVQQGIEPHRIKTFGFGETSLLVQIFGRERQNRRVEIEVFQLEIPEPLVFPLPEDE